MPVRVQRKRRAGEPGMPKGAIYVGRPSRWGNPISVTSGLCIGPPWSDVKGKPMQTGVWASHDAVLYSAHAPAELAFEHAVKIFRTYCTVQQRDYPKTFEKWIAPLRGRDLACWCPLEDADGNYVPCHADVLLSVAGGIPIEEVIRENIRRAAGKAL